MTDYDTLTHYNPAHADIVCINWCLGNTCNFSCSYCPSFLHSGSLSWIPIDTVLSFTDRLINHYVDDLNKQLYVEFTGGEVTLFKDFLRLAQALKDRDQWTGIITNGSRTPRFWNTAKELIDHACVSYHHEESNQDHFIETINQISDDVDVHVNVMVKPDDGDFQETLSMAQRIVDQTNNITFDLQTLLVDFGSTSYDYTPEHMAKIEQVGTELKKITARKRVKNRRSYRGMMRMIGPEIDERRSPGNFISMRENNWQGWSCAAGVENLVIDFNGDIFRGWCKQGGLIGNVKNPLTLFPTSDIVCGTDFCHCNFDVMCTKRKL